MPELYVSIIHENKLKQAVKVIFGRCIENLLLCLYLPQTQALCVFTKHCSDIGSYSQYWSREGMLFLNSSPFSIFSNDFFNGFFALNLHSMLFVVMTNVVIPLSIVVVTSSLILCQFVSLNRTFLMEVAMIVGEWECLDAAVAAATSSKGVFVESSSSSSGGGAESGLLEGNSSSKASADSLAAATAAAVPWDANRKYKKGDVIRIDKKWSCGSSASSISSRLTASLLLTLKRDDSNNDNIHDHRSSSCRKSVSAAASSSSFYRAKCDAPEGRPDDVFLRSMHDLFRNEVGHASGSYILATVTKLHLLHSL
jgi:hypothetical protein